MPRSGGMVEDGDESARLSGLNGTFRASGKNTYQAENDFEALRAWIESAQRRSLPRGTLATYTREVERFMLWAVLERKTAMSSMKPADFDEYEAFLANPPERWQSKIPVRRLSIPWRPMRGPLSPRSILMSMTVVRMLYRDWLREGYLRGDPANSYKSKFAAPSIYWLTTTDWELIEAKLRGHISDISERRTRAAVLLMRRCHLRQQDVVRLDFESLVRIQTPVPGFAVPVKEGVLRPIDHETWGAVEAHYADRVRLIAETSLGRFENVPDAAVPLIGAIVLAGIREVAAAHPIYAKDFRSKPNVIGRITRPVLGRFAWQFFEDIACKMPSDQASAFLSRARSWLNNPSRQTPERRRMILVEKCKRAAIPS